MTTIIICLIVVNILFLIFAKVFSTRLALVHEIAIKAIETDVEMYTAGPSFEKMLQDVRKWKYEDFYEGK